jgi:Tfp pilus assembly protein PilF
MSHRSSLLATLTAVVAACGAPPGPPAAARPAALEAVVAEARHDPAAVPPRLTRRALELEQHGRAIEACELVARELVERLRAAPWADPMLTADSVVAAAELGRLAHATTSWTMVGDVLRPARPYPEATPPELARRLDSVLARCLRRALDAEGARAITRAHGTLVDWRVVGPFANERGGGFDTAYPPEQAIDLTATLRGKERDVAWRANPASDAPLGYVHLHEMLRPNEQALAYLATAVRVATPRDVALHLGSTGAFKVWVDGTLVLARKVQRPMQDDQDRVAVALAPGWNHLLVKLCVEENEPWIAQVRLSELDGRPLRDLEVDSSRLAEPPPAPIAASGALAESAALYLESRADDAEALRLLARWNLTIHPDDNADRTARKWAEAALALEPDDVQGLYLLALANGRERGEKASEAQVNTRLQPLKRVLELDPRHVAAALDLAEFSMRESPQPERADELTARAVEAAPESWRALSLRAQFLGSRGRDAEAEALLRKARETRQGSLVPEAVRARAAEATWRGDRAGGIALVRAALAKGVFDARTIDALFDDLADTGDVEGARAVLASYLSIEPADTGRMLEAAWTLEHAGALDAAQALAERALAVCPESTPALLALARIAQRRDDIETADRYLAEVVRLDPGQDKVRRQRELLATTAEERFEAPFRRDALQIVAGAPDPGGADPIQVADRTTVWRVNPDGTEHRYERLLLRACNTGGVKMLDRYAVVYPSDSTLLVYAVRAIRRDGTFERAPAPQRDDPTYGSSRARIFDLPPLAAGEWVEIEYRVDQLHSDVFGQYFGEIFEFYADEPDPLAPVARSELAVIAPADVPLYFGERRAERLEKSVERDARGDVVYRWIARDLPRPELQSAMPSRAEIAPRVEISTYASWQAFARWWWSFIEKEFVTTPPMRAKVAELTAGLESEQDKVRAIARFVGQEIRYNAWAFGTHGYEPYSAATIYERRFGDCKDKSILLRQLLAEIGVEAIPVLIKAEFRRSEEPLDVAVIGQFNHCIAYLPPTAERPGYYLDATADRNPIEYLRSDDQGARVLHVGPDGGSIHEIPYAPPDENTLRREYEVALDPRGGAEVTLADSSDGAFGVQLRYAFGGEQGDLQKRIADALASSFGKVDDVRASTSKLEDIGTPARLDARFRATSVWTRDASGANLRLGFDPIGLLSVADEPPQERAYDLVLDRPFALDTRVVYRLPPNARVVRMPADASVSAAGLFDYAMTARERAGAIEVERRFTLHERRIPLARYADFRGALREVQLAEERTIVVDPGAAPEAGSKEDGR